MHIFVHWQGLKLGNIVIVGGHMKDFELTKDELEKRLKHLESTKDDHQIVGMFAMCYSPAFYEGVACDVPCSECGNDIHIDCVYGDGEENAITYYRELAGEYKQAGCDAEVRFYCNDCLSKKKQPKHADTNGTNAFFSVKLKGLEMPAETPINLTFYEDDELRMVLEFLKGADTMEDLDRDYGPNSLFESADDFIDCIREVLGLDAD